MKKLVEKCRNYITVIFAVYLLFITGFYCITAVHLFTDEEIVGNDILRYKEFYLQPLFLGQGVSHKFDIKKVGWAGKQYIKTEGGEVHDLGNGITITGNTISYTARDRHYFDTKP